MKGDFERYLAAKSTVDERALDRRVLGRFRSDLCERSNPQILEAGAGTAAFCRRILSWEGVPDCTYVAVDTDAALLLTARERILETARAVGFEASVTTPDDPDFDASTAGETAGTTVATIRLRGPARLDVRLVAGDACSVAADGAWDVLVAQAFVDLLSPDDVDRLLAGVTEGASVYLPITFDGGTAFAPPHPADAEILTAYHATMENEATDRLGATAGRTLLTLLPERGVSVDAVGGSDWIVSPLDGEYPADEAYFLSVIVDTVADAVRGRVPDETVDAWLERRRAEHGERRLTFVARNLDLYGRVDST